MQSSLERGRREQWTASYCAQRVGCALLVVPRIPEPTISSAASDFLTLLLTTAGTHRTPRLQVSLRTARHGRNVGHVRWGAAARAGIDATRKRGTTSRVNRSAIKNHHRLAMQSLPSRRSAARDIPPRLVGQSAASSARGSTARCVQKITSPMTRRVAHVAAVPTATLFSIHSASLSASLLALHVSPSY